MQRSFGHILQFSLLPSRSWLSLGPGWAMLAGALSTGYSQLDLKGIMPLLGLWLLVDPILGTLWELAGPQGLWRAFKQTQLPPPPRHGFWLPYAQVGSPAGRLVVKLRRYQAWWQTHFWPESGDRAATFGLGLVLALLVGFFLNLTIFWLTLLAIGLTLLAGHGSPELTAPGGGRLQSLVQFLLPWAMGATLPAALTPLSFIVALCYWTVYLAGLRMWGNHHRAELLFFAGQIAAVVLLLALRLLLGAAIASVMLLTQVIIHTKFNQPADFLARVHPYLIIAIVATGFALGSL